MEEHFSVPSAEGERRKHASVTVDQVRAKVDELNVEKAADKSAAKGESDVSLNSGARRD
jgi:hypothetical protein